MALATRSAYTSRRNVARYVKPPKADTTERRPFTPEQVAALFAATAGGPIGPLLVLSATTGLRQGEALALRWSDVDLENGLLAIEHTPYQRTRELAPTKTERSRRCIHLPSLAANALREQRLRTGRRGDGGFVFATAKGRPMDARRVVRLYHEARVRAGLPDLPWHQSAAWIS